MKKPTIRIVGIALTVAFAAWIGIQVSGTESHLNSAVAVQSRPTDDVASRSLERGNCTIQSCYVFTPPTARKPAVSQKANVSTKPRQHPSCSQIANSVWDGICPPAPTKAQVRQFEHVALRILGWDNPTQFACLDNIIDKESGWNVYDENRETAYGLPQALPGTKMATAGSDWGWNPATQLRWMIYYVHGKYGTPCLAWDFRRTHVDRHGLHYY